jgi:hypothetical protein
LKPGRSQVRLLAVAPRGCRSAARTPAFQAGYTGSSPVIRSNGMQLTLAGVPRWGRGERWSEPSHPGHAPLAQPVERRTLNPTVRGSSPWRRTRCTRHTKRTTSTTRAWRNWQTQRLQVPPDAGSTPAARTRYQVGCWHPALILDQEHAGSTPALVALVTMSWLLMADSRDRPAQCSGSRHRFL